MAFDGPVYLASKLGKILRKSRFIEYTVSG